MTKKNLFYVVFAVKRKDVYKIFFSRIHFCRKDNLKKTFVIFL